MFLFLTARYSLGYKIFRSYETADVSSLRISAPMPGAAADQEPGMKKRHASLHPFSDRPALPVRPAQSRCLVRPNR
jgi:hypothetical protein